MTGLVGLILLAGCTTTKVSDRDEYVEPKLPKAGRKLGADVAKELVKKISAMRMNVVRAEGKSEAELNDLALTGYFTSVSKGNAAERVLIGFGKGSAQVGVHAEGYHMTPEGMVKLDGGTADDGGAGKSPGLVVPALVTLATKNPIRLVVGGAVKAEGESTRSSRNVESHTRGHLPGSRRPQAARCHAGGCHSPR